MLAVKMKTLVTALALSAVAAGASAEQIVRNAVTDGLARAATPTKAVTNLPKAEAYPWDFAGIPRKGPAVLVNIPSFELIAFRDGKPVLRSKVIVGTRRTQTPVKQTETSVVRFRPTWTPTPDMIRRGTRPGTRRAGRRNPLGLLAVRLERGSLIYLHGTNKPHLFKRTNRSLSNGCIRVEKWDQVAAFVLNTTTLEVHKHANGRRTLDKPTNNVPVILGYFTKFPDAEGVMQTHKDIYRRGRDGIGPRVAGRRAYGQDRKFKLTDNPISKTKTEDGVVKAAFDPTEVFADATEDAKEAKPVSINELMSISTPFTDEDRTFSLQ